MEHHDSEKSINTNVSLSFWFCFSSSSNHQRNGVWSSYHDEEIDFRYVNICQRCDRIMPPILCWLWIQILSWDWPNFSQLTLFWNYPLWYCKCEANCKTFWPWGLSKLQAMVLLTSNATAAQKASMEVQYPLVHDLNCQRRCTLTESPSQNWRGICHHHEPGFHTCLQLVRKRENAMHRVRGRI